MDSIAKYVLLPFVVLGLSGCIDLETHIELNEDQSGRLTVSYAIDTELWELGVFDEESSVRAVPVSRKDFDRSARRVEGIELVSYSRSTGSGSSGDEVTEVEAVLRFSDLEALNELYAPGQSLISISEDGGERVYTQKLLPDQMQRVEDEELLESYFDGYEVSFEVETPESAVSTNLGELLERDRGAGVSFALTELLAAEGGEDAFEWVIRYGN
ncbi:MAG: hypothetical protein ACQETQ_00770 [Spirochaetota bacterium]